MKEDISSLKIANEALGLIELITELELLFNDDEELITLFERATKLISDRKLWDTSFYRVVIVTKSRFNAALLLLRSNKNDISYARGMIKKVSMDFINSIDIKSPNSPTPAPQEAA